MSNTENIEKIENTEPQETGKTKVAPKLPLTDEQASEASGGAVDSSIISGYRKMAESEGRPTHVGCNDAGLFSKTWRNANCPKCAAAESLFCKRITEGQQSPHRQPHDTVYVCIDTKCYVCGYIFGRSCELISGYGQVFIQSW